MRSRFVRAAILLSVVLVAVGCSKTLDSTGLQKELADQLNAKLNRSGITVACPDGIKAKAGGEFDCTGTVPDAGTVTIHVTQTDGDGHVTWEVTDVATGPAGASASGPSGTSGATASGPSGSS